MLVSYSTITTCAAPTPSPTTCPWTVLDFSTLTPGSYVTDELWNSMGIKISVTPSGSKGYAPNGAARVFDTSSPNAYNGISCPGNEGDPDLGSPNEVSIATCYLNNY